MPTNAERMIKMETKLDHVVESVDSLTQAVKEDRDASKEDRKMLYQYVDKKNSELRKEAKEDYAPKWVAKVVLWISIAIWGALISNITNIFDVVIK